MLPPKARSAVDLEKRPKTNSAIGRFGGARDMLSGRGLVSGGERNALAGVGSAVMGFLEAFSCARCAAAAVGGHPEVAPEIAQGSGAALHGFENLSVSDCFADADVHELLLITM